MLEDARQKGAVRPTLFIGLGGTGKEILLRLRRRFFETFGTPGLPCTKYLWMDTDTKDTGGAQGEVLDAVYKEVLFTESEKVGLLKGDVGNDLGDIFKSRDKHRFIHRWLYPSVEQFGAKISDGAGNVRAVGRLTWFSRFSEIESRISALAGSALTTESTNRTRDVFRSRGFETAPEFIDSRQAVIVFSVVGGTGSGTFLDTAFLLRHTGKFDRIIGVCVLPNIYFTDKNQESSARSYANSYAALKELEYYTVRRDREETQRDGGMPGGSLYYKVQWKRGEEKKVQGPPFDFVYMLEQQNEKGVGLESRSEFFKMAGEALYMDFMPGAFSTGKRSSHSNVVGALSATANDHVTIDDTVLPQTFARRYATFGLAKLGIPTEALKNACACQLAADLIGFWTRECRDMDILRSVRSDIGERRLSLDGVAGRFVPGWKDEVRRRVEAITGPLRASGKSCSLAEVESAREAALALEDAYIGASDATVDPEQNLPHRFNVRGPAVAEEIRQALDAWVNYCLDQPKRGLKGLLMTEAGAGGRKGYLQVMAEQLQATFLTDRSELKQRQDAAETDADRWREERDDAFEELKHAVMDTKVNILNQRAAAIEVLGRRMMEAEEQYLLCRADAALYAICREVVQEASGILAERTAGLDKFAKDLAGLTEWFNERKGAHLKPGENVLFIQVYDEETDWPKFYKLGNADVNLADEAKLMLGEKKGLYSLHEKMKEGGEDELREELRRHCEQRFIEDFRRYPRDVDLLKHPLLHSREDRRRKAEELVNAALGRALLDEGWNSKGFQMRREACIGIAEDNSDQWRHFKDELREELTGKQFVDDVVRPLPTTNRSEVYLYTVTYAFPVGMINLVARDCHETYYSFCRDLRLSQASGADPNKIPLHLDQSWEGQLDDLVWWGDDDARKIKEAYEILLFGAILRVTFRRRDKDMPVFGHWRRFVTKRIEKVWGGRREATETLKTDGDLRRDFLRAVVEREQNLTPDQKRAYAMAITYLVYADGFGPNSTEGTLLNGKHKQLVDMCKKASVFLEDPPENEQDPEKIWDWVKSKVGGGLVRTEKDELPLIDGLTDWEYNPES